MLFYALPTAGSVEMTPSPAALTLIKHFEGFRAEPYFCPAGKKSVGFGHVIGPDDHLPKTLSLDQADHLLRHDLESLSRMIGVAIECPLTQNQFDALCCLVYNIGTSAFLKSTLARKLNVGDDIESCASEFLRWDKATVNGQKVTLEGLTRRRAAERALFLGDL